jgi:hypothetical protein
MKWCSPTDASFYRGGATVVDWYNDMIIKRRQSIPDWKEYTTAESDTIAENITKNGYHKIENFWNTVELNVVRDDCHRAFQSMDPVLIKQTHGEQHSQISQPLLNVTSLNSLATDSRIIAIATSFFKCFPGFGTQNLRYSASENSREFGTCQFHRDFNSPVKILKFFTYLNDVTIDNGPFTYVEGSHRRLPIDWSRKLRWENEEIESLYGANSVKNLTGRYGDLIIATTNGFHKGLPLESGFRILFTMNFLVHHELGQSVTHLPSGPGVFYEGEQSPYSKRFKISKDFYEQLSADKKPLYDFMEKV